MLLKEEKPGLLQKQGYGNEEILKQAGRQNNSCLKLLKEHSEIQGEQADPTLEDLSEDDLFLFCVGFTCEQAYNEGVDRVEYNKDIASMVIMDIMEKWTQFPNPARILKRGMEDIVCLTFMKPPFMQSRKSAIIHGMLYPIAHTYGLNNVDKEALKQLFHATVRRLLTEDPTIECLKTLLETLSIYFNEDNIQERALATSSIRELLAYALKYSNLTAGVINMILPQELSALFQNFSQADIQPEVVDVFPVLYYEE